MRSNPHDRPWVVMIESSTVVSDEYTNAAVCITGSSGMAPSAFSHTRLWGAAPPCHA